MSLRPSCVFLIASSLLLISSVPHAQAPAPSDAALAVVYDPQKRPDITAPVLLSAKDPEYPRSWLHKNTEQNVIVSLVVSTQGMPEQIHIVRSGGKLFDDRAIKAVQTYRFTPAMKDGKPIAVEMRVEVNYRIH